MTQRYLVRRAKLDPPAALSGTCRHFAVPSCYSEGSPSPWNGKLMTLWPQCSDTAGWYRAVDLTLGTTVKLL